MLCSGTDSVHWKLQPYIRCDRRHSVSTADECVCHDRYCLAVKVFRHCCYGALYTHECKPKTEQATHSDSGGYSFKRRSHRIPHSINPPFLDSVDNNMKDHSSNDHWNDQQPSKEVQQKDFLGSALGGPIILEPADGDWDSVAAKASIDSKAMLPTRLSFHETYPTKKIESILWQCNNQTSASINELCRAEINNTNARLLNSLNSTQIYAVPNVTDSFTLTKAGRSFWSLPVFPDIAATLSENQHFASTAVRNEPTYLLFPANELTTSTYFRSDFDSSWSSQDLSSFWYYLAVLTMATLTFATNSSIVLLFTRISGLRQHQRNIIFSCMSVGQALFGLGRGFEAFYGGVLLFSTPGDAWPRVCNSLKVLSTSGLHLTQAMLLLLISDRLLVAFDQKHYRLNRYRKIAIIFVVVALTHVVTVTIINYMINDVSNRWTGELQRCDILSRSINHLHYWTIFGGILAVIDISTYCVSVLHFIRTKNRSKSAMFHHRLEGGFLITVGTILITVLLLSYLPEAFYFYSDANTRDAIEKYNFAIIFSQLLCGCLCAVFYVWKNRHIRNYFDSSINRISMSTVLRAGKIDNEFFLRRQSKREIVRKNCRQRWKAKLLCLQPSRLPFCSRRTEGKVNSCDLLFSRRSPPKCDSV
ncbi:hypothetical protein AB6A40_000011 [Gnathostoma spinigerum]|uniref:G-protein coupled receptors family 1 profile domain-containing protein n=1 Tax=Gnathostoma spinigerum TaxID=75299 RepID=A0ABD6E399_9BILA